jgi:AraC-like DNA-binding protein
VIENSAFLEEGAYIMEHICHFDGARNDLYVTEFGYHQVSRERTVGPRVRREYLLHIVTEGTCRFCDFSVPAGNALLITRGVPHYFSVEPGYEHFWIGFGGSGAEKFLEDQELDPHRHSFLPGRSWDYLVSMLALAYDACRQERQEQIALSALSATLTLLSPGELPGHLGDAERAKRFLDNNYSERITMEQVAAYVNLSEKHLCRKFRETFSVPPQKYLLKIRMEKARKLLRETELKVKEVADSVGYGSPLGFSEMYRRHFGISPSFDRR